MARPLLVALTAALTFAAVACGDDTTTPDALADISSTTTTTTTPLFVEADGSATVTTVSDSTAADLDDSASSDDTTTIGSSSATTTPQSGSTGPENESSTDDQVGTDCIVGTWQLDDQAYLEALVRAVDTAGQIEAVAPRSGRFVIGFADDGTFVGTREAWQFVMTTIQGDLVTTIDSADTGNYSIDGDQLTIIATDDLPSVQMQLETGGEVEDLEPGSSVTIGDGPLSTSGSFTCDAEELSTPVDVPGVGQVTATWTRI